MTEHVATNETILVVGGGISGMTAALEAAETGKNVVLVEKNPALGGRTSQLYRYFPKLCHPTCGLEINLRRLKGNPRIRVLTLAEVTGLSGSTGNYTASIKVKPRYVNENCTACGDCGRAVEMKVDDPFNYNLGQHKAAYLPNAMAYPQRYVLDPAIIGSADADTAKAACKYGAIDLDMKEETIQVKAGAVVWATGWQPYDAAKIQPYGYGRFKNVITSVEFERLADIHGPTGGKILRPSDGKEAKNIAFIQCAGSRDENHLRHCSRICCMASLKQTHYVREKYPEDGKSTIYYIDIRAIDRFEDFYQKVQADPVGQLHQVQGREDHRRRAWQRGVPWRRHRRLQALHHAARPGGAGGRHGALGQGHQHSRPHRRGFERLHRGRPGQRRGVRRRLRVECAGREPRRAIGHGGGTESHPGGQ